MKRWLLALLFAAGTFAATTATRTVSCAVTGNPCPIPLPTTVQP